MNWRNVNNLNLCVASAVSAALRGFKLRRVAPTNGRRFGELLFHRSVRGPVPGRLGGLRSTTNGRLGSLRSNKGESRELMGDSEVSPAVKAG